MRVGWGEQRPPSQVAQSYAVMGAVLLLAARFVPFEQHPIVICPLRLWAHLPCPACGMTRACVAAVHGDLAGSLRYNPAGMLVLALAVALVVSPRLARVRVHVPLWATLLAVGALWLWNIGFNPTFHQLLL